MAASDAFALARQQLHQLMCCPTGKPQGKTLYTKSDDGLHVLLFGSLFCNTLIHIKEIRDVIREYLMLEPIVESIHPYLCARFYRGFRMLQTERATEISLPFTLAELAVPEVTCRITVLSNAISDTPFRVLKTMLGWSVGVEDTVSPSHRMYLAYDGDMWSQMWNNYLPYLKNAFLGHPNAHDVTVTMKFDLASNSILWNDLRKMETRGGLSRCRPFVSVWSLSGEFIVEVAITTPPDDCGKHKAEFGGTMKFRYTPLPYPYDAALVTKWASEIDVVNSEFAVN